jgi:hypothetical protein
MTDDEGAKKQRLAAPPAAAAVQTLFVFSAYQSRRRQPNHKVFSI